MSVSHIHKKARIRGASRAFFSLKPDTVYIFTHIVRRYYRTMPPSLLSPWPNHYFSHPVSIPRFVRSRHRRHLRPPHRHCSTRRGLKFRIQRPTAAVGNQFRSSAHSRLSSPICALPVRDRDATMAARAAASAGDVQGGRCLLRREIGFLLMHGVTDVRHHVRPLRPLFCSI
jgi:hypothetical protein